MFERQIHWPLKSKYTKIKDVLSCFLAVLQMKVETHVMQ